jgi:hypothetical protein
MFSEWSRPYPHLDPGEPEKHKLILYFREGTVRNEKLSQDGPAVYDRVYQVEVAAIGQKQSRPRYTLLRVSQGQEIKNTELQNINGPDGRMKGVTAYERFRKAFEEYRQNVAPSSEGVPLEHWPLMTSEIVRAFKDVNIHSVEDLANASDSAAQHVRGEFYKWRNKAQAWLEAARKDGGDVQARAELADLKQQLAQAQSQIAELLSAQNRERPEPPRKRKRRDDEVVIPDSAFEPEEERL